MAHFQEMRRSAPGAGPRFSANNSAVGQPAVACQCSQPPHHFVNVSAFAISTAFILSACLGGSQGVPSASWRDRGGGPFISCRRAQARLFQRQWA